MVVKGTRANYGCKIRTLPVNLYTSPELLNKPAYKLILQVVVADLFKNFLALVDMFSRSDSFIVLILGLTQVVLFSIRSYK